VRNPYTYAEVLKVERLKTQAWSSSFGVGLNATNIIHKKDRILRSSNEGGAKILRKTL
jgi:hypothetical protein